MGDPAVPDQMIVLFSASQVSRAGQQGIHILSEMAKILAVP